MGVGGTSALFQCETKVENKVRLNKARFSLFLLVIWTEQPAPPPAAALPCAGLTVSAARARLCRSSCRTSGEGLGTASSCHSLERITQGGERSGMRWEDFLPSGADSPDNLALYLQKHKAFNCMSFWCFWIASLWRWNSNHHQSYRLATDRKNRHIIKLARFLVISPLLIQSVSANTRRESLHGCAAGFAYNQVSKPALLRPFVQLRSLPEFS